MMIEKWKSLPEGILMDILTWLPVKSVLRFRCVSKNWCNHFTNPDFIKLHVNHSNQMNHSSLILTKQEETKYYSRDEPYSASFPSLDYKISGDNVRFDMSVEYHCPFHYWKYSITILGSCNGLFCLQSDPELLFIWNPITNDYQKLLQAPNEPQGVVFPVKIFGFGYDCKTGDYKVVKIFMPGRVKLSKVWIYTSGTNSWRVLADVPCVFFLSGELKNGTSLNGVLHWLVHPLGRGNKPIRVVLTFDVGNEEFGEMHLPVPLCGAPEGVNYFKTSIGLLDGKLCLSWYVSDGNVDVWVMKNYGVTESWTKLFRISWLKEEIGYLRAVQPLKNGDILLFRQPLNKLISDGDLILYSSMNGNARFLDTSGYQKLEDACTYVGSLVSVQSIVSQANKM